MPMMRCLLRILWKMHTNKGFEMVYKHLKMGVNSSRTEIILIKTQNKEKPCKVYNNQPLEARESFIYLGFEVPQIIATINVSIVV